MGKLLALEELEIGMILERDVVEESTGVVLVAANRALTKNIINRLNNSDIKRVSIKEEKPSQNSKSHNFVEGYAKVEKKLDNIFDTVKKEGKLDSEDLKQELKLFVSEVIEVSNISAQLRSLKKRDDYTFNHSMGVSILAVTLGKWLGYDEENIVDLSIAGLLHDIGKLRIPDEILNKPGKLTKDEFERMKNHSKYGYEMILETGKFNEDILLGVLHHHEKLDGSGYPHGLKGEDTHDYAKIISVCDIYDALTSDRVYKSKDNPFNVADYLRDESFKSLDPNIVGVFLDNMSRFYVGNDVLLSDGSLGTIIYIHPRNTTRPIVKVDDKYIDFLKEDTLEIVDVMI